MARKAQPASRPEPARRAVGAVPSEVRIIGGQWKRTRLAVADKAGLRPTPDRVRETLFNWLSHDLSGWRCVDAFAGTGALGLEAASRGATQVLLVEQDAELVARLRDTVTRLNAQAAVKVERGNALSVLARLAAASTDLIFLDPPFDANLADKALGAAAPALAPEGVIYLEAPSAWNDASLSNFGLSCLRHLKAGAVHAHLLGRTA